MKNAVLQARQAPTPAASHDPTLAHHATAVPVRRLQRKCACGGHSSGECVACKDERDSKLSRAAEDRGVPGEVPFIVYDVLHQAGAPLDASTRAVMGRRFEHDFSGVRVHTDAEAAASARSVHALAYTVGQHVVFGPGRFDPLSQAGRALLAHELQHTIQQGDRPFGGYELSIGAPTDAAEIEADRAAEYEPVNAVGASGPSRPSDGRTVGAGTVPPNIARFAESRKLVEPSGETVDVTRNVTPGHCASESSTKKSATVGAAGGRAFIELMICRGASGAAARGEIDYGPALQQVSAATARLLQGLQSGRNQSRVLQRFEQDMKAVTPSAAVRINLQVPGVRAMLLGTARASAGQGVAATGTARVEGDIRPVTIGVEGQVSGGTNQPTGYQAVITFGWNLPHGPSPQCYTCACTDPKVEFSCVRHPVPGTSKPPDVPQPVVLPLFFVYATTKPREAYAETMAAAVRTVESGYRIARIEGSCSPEGPLRKGPGFEGNVQLAQDRADKADKDLREGLRKAAVVSMRGVDALQHAINEAHPVVGRGELFGGAPGSEIPERALPKHLREVLKTPGPDEKDPLVEEHVIGGDLPPEVSGRASTLVGQFRAGRGGVETIYPLFRRALIFLEPIPPSRGPIPIQLSPDVLRSVLGDPIPCDDRHRQVFDALPLNASQLYEGNC